MAVRGLGRAAVAATVVGDHAVAVLHEEHHLGVPVVGTERPAVVEHDRLTAAPVLVEDLRAVLGGDEGHVSLLWSRGRHGRRLRQRGPPATLMRRSGLPFTVSVRCHGASDGVESRSGAVTTRTCWHVGAPVLAFPLRCLSGSRRGTCPPHLANVGRWFELRVGLGGGNPVYGSAGDDAMRAARISIGAADRLRSFHAFRAVVPFDRPPLPLAVVGS